MLILYSKVDFDLDFVFKATFQQYFSYIMAVSFIGGGNTGLPRENH
jgi:hypothetical protein